MVTMSALPKDDEIITVPSDPTTDARRRRDKPNAATGASAAGIRALSAQFFTFYFRAPAKAFFRTRVDYTAYARAINPHIIANERWSLRMTTPAILAHAVRQHGWSFIPQQVLPPMLANVTVGAVLYTTYLQSLGLFYPPASEGAKRMFPPAPLLATASAGFLAGTVQSLIAAPLDALTVRFDTSDMLEGRYKTMLDYSRSKLREIGLRGVMAGWSLSFLKDSFGFAIFFSAFEFTKSQLYYGFVTNYYGRWNPGWQFSSLRGGPSVVHEEGRPVIKPHYMLEPAFIALGGVGASVAQQAVQHPITAVQNVHLGRLESLDLQAKMETSGKGVMRLYYHAYEKTLEQCGKQAQRAGGWRRWLYQGFLMNTLRQVPSTSAGLIVFEIVRRKYGIESEAVKIQKDGFDILVG